MIKNYLIDTNVMLRHFEEILETWENVGLIIPSKTIEELDAQKSGNSEIAYLARRVIRRLFEIKKYGNISEWIKLDKNVSIHIEHNCNCDLDLNYNTNDDFIVGTLSFCNDTFGKTILLSNDLNICLKSEIFGFETEQFGKHSNYNFYSGHIEKFVEDDIINLFYKEGKICWENVLEDKPLDNMCVTLISINDNKKQAMSIFRNGVLEKLKYGNSKVFGGTTAKNRQQKYLLELLMDDNIKIVAVNSPAGAGKSFLTTVVGLQKVLEDNVYDKIIYVKPLEPMGGKDIGYLPSSKNDKLLGGYAGTLINILENIFAKREKQYNKLSYVDDLMEKGYLQVEAPTFMRGMSYINTFVIVDEASNLNASDIKNICTRCGENSRIFLIGDGLQLDNSKVNVFDNGLQHVIENLKGSELFGTIQLDKSVRSDVAQLCVDKL